MQGYANGRILRTLQQQDRQSAVLGIVTVTRQHMFDIRVDHTVLERVLLSYVYRLFARMIVQIRGVQTLIGGLQCLTAFSRRVHLFDLIRMDNHFTLVFAPAMYLI